MNPHKAPALTRQQESILGEISRPIAPVPRTRAYALKMLLATLALLLVGGLYFSIVGGAAWFGIHAFSTGLGLELPAQSGRGVALGFLLFRFAPAFACICVVVALVKPLVVRGAEVGSESGFEISPQYEPALFAFTGRLCQAIRAPEPAAIAVDTQVNASASFLRGPWDGRLRLTIGLPLVLGLTTQQLAGVLAHELGHFSQRGGMTLTWMIRTLNHWLARAAWERDRWDEWLEGASQTSDFRLSWIFYTARGVVWFARLVLQGLFFVSMFFCARLLQEMELDADRHEARVAGSLTFATTARQIQRLSLCHAAAMEDLDRFQRENRLPDNLPALIVANVPLVAPDVFQAAEKLALASSTGRFDTHPSDRDRILNAAAERSPGTIANAGPASILFRDVAGLARLVTLRFYQGAFGSDLDPRQIHPTELLVEQLNREHADDRLGRNFLLHQFDMHRTFSLPRPKLGTGMDKAGWKQVAEDRRKRLLESVVRYSSRRRERSALMDEMAEIACVKKLLDDKVRLATLDRRFAVRDSLDVRNRLLELLQRETSLEAKLEPFREVLGQRLIDALELTRSEKITAKTGEPAGLGHEVNRLLRCWNVFAGNRLQWDRFALDLRVTFMLLETAQSSSGDRLVASVESQILQLHRQLRELLALAADVRYPFSHGDGEVTVARYLIRNLPARDDHGGIVRASMEMLRNMGLLVESCARRLGAVAARVEQAAGLPPLDLPPELGLPADRSVPESPPPEGGGDGRFQT